ncbi:MAG: hypothetical protein EB060_10535 [Proteobacteria bacterium]|nr:hypothetical protein [Pseudomonadota bacterium]
MTDPPGVNIDWKKIDERKRMGLANGMLATQVAMSRYLRDLISKPGTGRLYRIGAGKFRARNLREQGLHRASAPGRPPTVDTGRLRQSWAVAGNANQKFSVRGALFGHRRSTTQDMATLDFQWTPTGMRFSYGSNLKYARALEYGGGRGRMKPRPYVRPTIAWSTIQAPRLMKLWMQKEMARP